MNLLITGAGRGLGLVLAAEALERGHYVLAGMRNPEHAGEAYRELERQFGERLQAVRLDASDEDGIASLAAELARDGRTLGSIVNNAAVLEGQSSSIEELDFHDMEVSFDINLYGPMRVVKHMLPLLQEPNASVINISSEAGSLTNAYPGNYPYTISKTALNMFTKKLSGVLKERGAIALSVHPGWMQTDMGGKDATLDPRESARGIMDLIERKIEPKSSFQFVDHVGREMEI